jgi:replication initiator protein RepSA
VTDLALTLGPVLVDGHPRPGEGTRTLDAELLDRATRDDYQQWLGTALAAGGCVRPVRLRGTVRDIDAATGEVIRDLDTQDLPDRAIYVPCGDRRASVCPPCAETYRADTYQLIRAGLAGGKGMPESVSIHPCVFATFTAPSFGPVHTRVELPGGKIARCRPRRKASYCPHGRRISCGQRHTDTDACLGRPFCPDCYDYSAAVVWNAHASELWRRTVITLRRQLAKLARKHGVRVKLSYAKVAEFQRRGLIHFHAIFRLDGVDPVQPERTVPPHPGITAELLADLIRQVAARAWFATVSHPMKPNGWDITWGNQVDPRVVRLTGGGQINDVAVASYLAKYATKSTEAVGPLTVRITPGTHWTDDGDGHEDRSLKNRPRRAVRIVPIPPELVMVLRGHIERYRQASDGRLFSSEHGRVLYPSSYWQVWQRARPLALTPAQIASPLARRPYDLRHGGVSLRLNAGVPATQVAEWAGHSVEVLLTIYAKCISGRDQVWFDRIDRALDEGQ